MKPEETNQIKSVIDKYKSKKNVLLNERNDVELKLRNGEIMTWTRDFLIDNLYKDFYETTERKEYQELAKKATEKDEFEKYFRSAHLLAFFNIEIDPKTL